MREGSDFCPVTVIDDEFDEFAVVGQRCAAADPLFVHGVFPSASSPGVMPPFRSPTGRSLVGLVGWFVLGAAVLFVDRRPRSRFGLIFVNAFLLVAFLDMARFALLNRPGFRGGCLV